MIGFINAVGVFQTYYQENQLSEYTAFQIGWLSSFLVFFMNLGVVSSIFELMSGNCCGTIIRYLRSSVVTADRIVPQCLRFDDDFPV
jgi:hypothetical protein